MSRRGNQEFSFGHVHFKMPVWYTSGAIEQMIAGGKARQAQCLVCFLFLQSLEHLSARCSLEVFLSNLGTQTLEKSQKMKLSLGQPRGDLLDTGSESRKPGRINSRPHFLRVNSLRVPAKRYIGHSSAEQMLLWSSMDGSCPSLQGLSAHCP